MRAAGASRLRYSPRIAGHPRQLQVDHVGDDLRRADQLQRLRAARLVTPPRDRIPEFLEPRGRPSRGELCQFRRVLPAGLLRDQHLRALDTVDPAQDLEIPGHGDDEHRGGYIAPRPMVRETSAVPTFENTSKRLLSRMSEPEHTSHLARDLAVYLGERRDRGAYLRRRL